MLAVVERKTLDNLLADFGMMQVLPQRLVELATHENHALVIESPMPTSQVDKPSRLLIMNIIS